MSTNCLGYFTVPVADLARGQAFYGGLFGWQFEAAPGEQRYAHIGNTTPPGGVSVGAARVPQVWFRIDDIRTALARVRALGGTAEEPQESPSGWSSACHDDQGTQFNLWQPAPGY